MFIPFPQVLIPKAGRGDDADGVMVEGEAGDEDDQEEDDDDDMVDEDVPDEESDDDSDEEEEEEEEEEEKEMQVSARMFPVELSHNKIYRIKLPEY